MPAQPGSNSAAPASNTQKMEAWTRPRLEFPSLLSRLGARPRSIGQFVRVIRTSRCAWLELAVAIFQASTRPKTQTNELSVNATGQPPWKRPASKAVSSSETAVLLRFPACVFFFKRQPGRRERAKKRKITE
jgi:hypothetical protein